MGNGHAVHHLLKKFGEKRPEPALRKAVYNEQIHPDMVQFSLIKLHLLVILVNAAVVVNDAGGKIIEHLSSSDILRPQKRHPLRQLPSCHLQKFLIIRAGENHVRIVVPGDKALMPDCAQQRARVNHIFNFIFPADSVNLL